MRLLLSPNIPFWNFFVVFSSRSISFFSLSFDSFEKDASSFLKIVEFLLDRAGLFFYGPARSCLDFARIGHPATRVALLMHLQWIRCLFDRAGLFFYGPARSCLAISRVDHGLIGSWPWSPSMGALLPSWGRFPSAPGGLPSPAPCPAFWIASFSAEWTLS